MLKYSLLFILFFITIFISCKKDAAQQKSSEKKITSFIFKATDNGLSSDAAGIISNDTISIKLPASANLHQLTPVISFTGQSITPEDSLAQDFSVPVHYKVIAEDGSSITYTVIVNYLSSIKEITSFVFTSADNPGLTADITAEIKGDTISAIIPVEANLQSLRPVVSYKGKSILPENNSAVDFSSLVNYTVTAEDGTVKTYVVLINANKTVFVSCGNYLYALNAANGTVRWKYDAGFAVTAPVCHNGVVFVGGQRDYLYAINADDGTVKWKDEHRFGDRTTCTVKEGFVYCTIMSLGAWYAYAVDEATGRLKWEYKFPYVGSYSELRNPTVANGKMYMTSGMGGSVYCLDATNGTFIWRAHVGISYGNPLVKNGEVYIGGEVGELAAINALTGILNWKVTTEILPQSSPATKDNIVYNSRHAIDVNTHTEKWKPETNYPGRDFTSPYVYKDLIFVLNDNGRVYVYYPDGTIKWVSSFLYAPFYAPSSLVVANGTAYMCGKNGNVYALDAETSIIKWIFKDPNIGSAPCVVDASGVVYNTSDCGDNN